MSYLNKINIGLFSYENKTIMKNALLTPTSYYTVQGDRYINLYAPNLITKL